MRNKNWTTIGIVVLIAGLLYYFFMQEGCVKCGKGSKSEVATSMDVVEAEEEFADDGYGAEDIWMEEEDLDDSEDAPLR